MCHFLQDGTVIIHTLLKGHYVRTLQPPMERPGASLNIPAMCISDEGQIAIHCRQQLGSNKINQVGMTIDRLCILSLR